MSRILLIAGGLLNLVFGLFHIWLGYQIGQLSDPNRGLMLALNAGGALFIFFFAWASLFRGDELMITRLGRGVLVLASLLYLSRAAEEFLWFTFKPAIFVACLCAGGIYAVLFFRAAAESKARFAPAEVEKAVSAGR